MDKHIIKTIFLIPALLLWLNGSVYGTPGLSKADGNLGEYLDYAVSNNPGLKSAFMEWQASIQEIQLAKSMPDPLVSFGYFLSPLETRVGPQAAKVGLSQKLPWFGKLSLKGQAALERSKSLEKEFQRQKAGLFYNVKRLYYEYYYVRKAVDILTGNIGLLESAADQMKVMYSTDRISYNQLIRVNLELEKLRIRKKKFEDLIPVMKTSFNSLLNKNIEENVNVPTKIEAAGLLLDRDQLRKQLLQTSPVLKKLDHLALSMEHGIQLSEKNYWPDFILGGDVILTGSAEMDGVRDSGRDPVNIRMSLSIPLNRKRIRASVKQAQYNLERVQSQKADQVNQLISLLEKAESLYRNATGNIELYTGRLIPLAEQAMKSSRKAFSTGKTDYLEMIDTQRSLLELQLSREREIKDQYQALALMEKILGRDIQSGMQKTENSIREETR